MALGINMGDSDEPQYRRGIEDAEYLIAAEKEKTTKVMEVLRRLVDTLPKCDGCKKPATRAICRGEGRWCDEHMMQPGLFTGELYEVPEYPRAAALREAIAFLSNYDRS